MFVVLVVEKKRGNRKIVANLAEKAVGEGEGVAMMMVVYTYEHQRFSVQLSSNRNTISRSIFSVYFLNPL